MTLVRIRLWDTTGTNRGRGTLKALIDDAANVGVGTYANAAGSCHFTLPFNHPQVAQCVPKLRHYQVSRVATDGTEKTVGVGLLDDYDATENEVVFYGIDYLGLFDRSISAKETTYTSTDVGTIIKDEAILARDQQSGGTTNANSVLGFISTGTFDTTSLTPTTILTSYQPRLQFIQSLISLWAGSNSTPVRPLFSVTREPTFTMSFSKSTGTDKDDVALVYGANVTHFRYIPGWKNYRTAAFVLGQKRDGASVLYSTQTGGDPSTYGISQEPFVHIDVEDQTALDNLAKHDARVAARIGTGIALTVASGALVPWDGYDLGDSLPVTINRGPVALAGALYTLNGLQWTMLPDGSEQLVLALQPKDV